MSTRYQLVGNNITVTTPGMDEWPVQLLDARDSEGRVTSASISAAIRRAYAPSMTRVEWP
jgi:hypothetical protein